MSCVGDIVTVNPEAAMFRNESMLAIQDALSTQ
jgi:hypothetical protein